MALQNQNETVFKGNHIVLSFFIEDAPSLNGYTAAWSMAQSVNGPKLITKSTPVGNGIAIDLLTVKVFINPGETDQASGLAPGDYYHELKLMDNTGKPFTAATGTLTLKDVLNKE